MLRHVALALTLEIAAATFEYPGRARLEDVFEFFNTHEEIFLSKRSYSRKIEGFDPACISNRVKEKNASMIRLYQRYEYGATSKPRCFAYGVYYNVSKQPGMDVAPAMVAMKTKGKICGKAASIENKNGMLSLGFERDYNDGRTYLFQYYDPLAKCAVITFTDKKYSIKCELHVWYSYYHKDKSNCLREYKDLCGNRPTYDVNKHDLCKWTIPKQ